MIFTIRLNEIMIDDLRGMAIFATVVSEGSFRAAAGRLKLSPSVVSHHVSQLEKRLGCALLYRSTRQLSLTDDGRVFYESCARAVEAAEEALDLVSERQRQLSGRLRIAAPALLADAPFMDDLYDFVSSYPDVEIDLHLDDVRINQVQEGFDVAIRIGWLEDSGLRARHLTTINRWLCVAPSLAAKHPPPKHPSELADWPWVHESMLPRFIDFTGPDGEACRVPINSRLSCNNVEASRRFAVNGAGLFASLDFVLKKDLKAGRLVRLLPEWQMSAPGIYAVWPTNAARGSLAHRFVSFIAERLGKRRKRPT